MFFFLLFIFIFNSQAQEFKIKTEVDINDFVYKTNRKMIINKTLKFKSLSKHKYSKAITVLNNAISKYPKEIFKYINTVYILDQVIDTERPINGITLQGEGFIFLTYNDDLTCDCEKKNCDFRSKDFYSAYEFEKTFHHEFCHILMFEFFDLERRKWRRKFQSYWSEFNQISYVKKDKDVWKRQNNVYKKDTVNDDFFYEMGFLSGYASSSIDEDMAVTIENMFMNRKAFWEFINKNQYTYNIEEEKINPLLRKTQIAAKFYNYIDPEFSFEYFKSLK